MVKSYEIISPAGDPARLHFNTVVHGAGRLAQRVASEGYQRDLEPELLPDYSAEWKATRGGTWQQRVAAFLGGP